MRRQTPVLESLFNKVAGLRACNFIKKRLQHPYFLVNIVKFLRTVYRGKLKNSLSRILKLKNLIEDT